MGVQKSTGIALSTSIFGSGPTFCGSRREVPKGDKMSIGVGLSISRLSDYRVPVYSVRLARRPPKQCDLKVDPHGAQLRVDGRWSMSERKRS